MMTQKGSTHFSAEALGAAPGRGRLSGRRLLVVGAGQRRLEGESEADKRFLGNGRAICALAAREGAAVACADRDASSLEGTLALVEEAGARAVRIIADATEEESVERMVNEAVAALGGLDGLVMNLGAGAGKNLAGTSVKLWDRLFAINARSHFLGCKHALPALADDGAIVLISSIAGYKPVSTFPAYEASKAALGGLCRHVAREGATRRVRVNVVAPGFINTPIGRLGSQGRPEREDSPVPLGRQGTGWEIAYTTIFLLSHEASYITGQTINVDGGVSTLV
jgi:NAD(P)-dependent dehydrogenase (short-subunit alcohol dehydrogenase family)